MARFGKWTWIAAGVAALVATGGAPGTSAAWAELQVGTQAPDFTTRGALGGHVFRLHLAEQLRKGPVVLYFFPAAFTPGCTAEAREFAEKSDEFKAAGATVIGMSSDPIGKLAQFSTEECRSKFAVASAGPRIIQNYQVALQSDNPALQGRTDRTSYVISQAGRIVYVHSALDYRDHVANTLAAVKQLQAGNLPGR